MSTRAQIQAQRHTSPRWPPSSSRSRGPNVARSIQVGMGQNATRPLNTAGEGGPSRAGHSAQGSNGSTAGSRDRSSATATGPASVAHLPPVVVDGGHTVPQGVYPGAPQDFNHQVVRSLIIGRKLCPFYPTVDDDDEGQDGNGDFATEEDTIARPATECPICFLVSCCSIIAAPASRSVDWPL